MGTTTQRHRRRQEVVVVATDPVGGLHGPTLEMGAPGIQTVDAADQRMCTKPHKGVSMHIVQARGGASHPSWPQKLA